MRVSSTFTPRTGLRTPGNPAVLVPGGRRRDIVLCRHAGVEDAEVQGKAGFGRLA
jgi:hypothetical protein